MNAPNPVETQDEVVISADSHLAEPFDLWETRLPAKFRDRAPRFPHAKYGQGQHARTGGWDPNERLKDMSIDGVSAEVLYPTIAGAGYRLGDVALGEACCRAYNDWAAEYCRVAPDRLWGQGLIPLWNMDFAVEELERCKNAGLVGATTWVVPPDDIPYESAHHEPFWAAAEELELPVSMHHSAGFGPYVLPTPSRTSVALQRRLVNTHFYWGMNALTDIICSGVLERHPRLQIVQAEISAGWMPFWAQQSDNYLTVNPVDPPLKMRPSDYLWRQVYTTFVDDDVAIWMLQKWGQENFMWSSDYPHSGGLWPASRQAIAGSMAQLPADVRRNIVCNNVARLYNKPVPAPIERAAEGVSPDEWVTKRVQV